MIGVVVWQTLGEQGEQWDKTREMTAGGTERWAGTSMCRGMENSVETDVRDRDAEALLYIPVVEYGIVKSACP